ncbi:hypothetical protein CP985_02970 [Malaciobacter mytili LMG 24559]|uniref:Polysaccharide biosynthesis protein n=2 Tax=Malaciobacter mytili TaxID=603050 RepID=A0AAX2AJK0_9BACT|nr:oligosaccharide flippase family protein [Malaciobacter mytili]AXH14305.1 polysaccharide biosynthesis protein [Malaciobacter mytili LMG 24559]RXK16527.1 hypothetical protein CP985_02970 [Malaciobacter mytili LMG 24559]
MKKSIVKITFVQLLLLLIPITVNIYLLRIISLDVYGQFIFYQSVFNFLSILINSGLANDSLRDLSFHYGKEKFIIKLNEYISAKLFYLGLSIIFCLIVSLNNNFNNILFYVSFTYLFYFFFDFMILYQVMDKIGTNLNINLVSFLFTVCGLFLFVQNDSDIIYVPLIATIPFIIINFLVLSLILKKNSFFFKFNISLLICKIKNNLKIMVSNIISAIVTKGIFIFIGIFLDMRAVAVYSVLDQIVRAPLIFINRYSSLFTPKITSKILLNDLVGVKLLFSKIFMSVLLLSISTIIILMQLSDFILPFFLKENYNETIKTLFFIMLLCIPLISLSSLCSVQYHINLHNEYLIFRYSLFLLFLGFPLILLFMYLFQIYGLIICYITIEFLVTLYFFIKLEFNPIRVFYEYIHVK